MVCRYSVILRKERWNYLVIPQSPFACAGPNQRGSRRPLHQQSCRSLHTRKRVPGSQKLAGPRVSTLRSGTPGTIHRHVTGPQVVSQWSLKEQPFVRFEFLTDSYAPTAYMHSCFTGCCPKRVYLQDRDREQEELFASRAFEHFWDPLVREETSCRAIRMPESRQRAGRVCEIE